ncbi:Dirigent protein 21 [Cardamine amara subsp. amara]|uniref:Dirigent protein n=1 Tax=Cardamine amara subsp. amara TaxID=228776 RepID=A0ABD0ZG27_CARAN
MASILLLLLPLFSVLLFTATITESETFSTTVKAPYPGNKPEKLTHIHFYFHDIVSGDKPTAVAVARGTKRNSSATFLGVVAVADDPLTVGPEITSGEVGRAQGVYATADQKKSGLLMTFNLVFTMGEFSGSTVAMYGRNPIWSKVREMPFIGGTGAFRFGSGYAQAKTFRSILLMKMLWLSIMSMFGISF